MNRSNHCAHAVLMVAPTDFEFNSETSRDNAFQHLPTEPAAVVRQRAMDEFDDMVATLRAENIEVVVLPPRSDRFSTPDAVFPNNWIAMESDATVVLFPMAPENRRPEKRIHDAETALTAHGFYIQNIVHVGRMQETKAFLEGTGSAIIDHPRGVVYASRSDRCHPVQLQNFVKLRGYKEGVIFDTASRAGKPFYHTNVMMSLGERFAVVCSAAITPAPMRQNVLQRLAADHEVIDLSLEQTEGSLCANILQLRNAQNESIIMMSRRAHDGFTPDQRRRLQEHGRLVPVALDTIENVGGGSARCMLAEIFLPKRASAVRKP